MLEKVVKLGFRQDQNFFYGMKEDGIYRVAVTHDEDGDAQPVEGAAAELVAPRSWDYADGYTYRLDPDGDLARCRILPEQRWGAERSLPPLHGDHSSSPVNRSPRRYWVIAGDEEPDAYLAPDREAVWSYYGDAASEVELGDAVFVWIDRPHCCVVALAEVSSPPRPEEDGATQISLRFLTNTTERPLYRDDLLYDPLLDKAAFLQPKPDAVTELEGARAQRLLRWMQHRNPATTSACAVWSSDLARRLGADDPFVPPDAHEREPVKPPPRTIEAVQLTSGQEYRVLSVHPPWAWAIIFAGKDVENRSWTTPYRGPILIHASSKKYVGRALEEARAEIAKNSGLDLEQIPTTFARSQVVGLVHLEDCVPNSRSRWANKGDEHWVLAHPRRLEPPTANVDGKLNLWTWTAP